MKTLKFQYIPFILFVNLSPASMFDTYNSKIGSVGLIASSTTGTIYFHGYVPTTSSSSFQDNMVLDGDKYTDLIMSNYIAGVLLGYNITKIFPGINFDKDYIYGSLMGQLLQENFQTQDYLSTTNLIDPSPNQVYLMGVGQGGPYQINGFYWDMVGGNYSPSGYSLINYVAIQKNIGFTMAEQPNQKNLVVPPIFNNKYFGPILAAYYIFNNFRSLLAINKIATNPIPNFNKCITLLANIANNPLDIIDSYAYNQGFYGGLLNQATTDCVKMTSKDFLNKYNNFSNAGSTSGQNINTYLQYPYQVRFYLNEFYNMSLLNLNVTVSFSIQQLRSVFVSVFGYLAYIDQNNNYTVIPSNKSGAAFDLALSKLNIPSTATYNLSDNSQRSTIYSLLENSIKNLEISLPNDFSQTVTYQISIPLPTCPNNVAIYPVNLGTYKVGTIVIGIDKKYYSCIVANLCNTQPPSQYTIGSGFAWSQAWTEYQCKLNN